MVATFLSVPLFTFDASAENTWSYTYTVTDGEATITGTSAEPVGELIIPATIDGYPVVKIANWAFMYDYEITSAVIPNGVTSIGNNAFYGCEKLTSIAIPDSVTSIGNAAFRLCLKLSGVVLPDNITYIGKEVFSSCSSLTSIDIPDSVTVIDYSAFHGCEELVSVTLPSSLTSIGELAFFRCTKLTELDIPEGTKSIGRAAFAYCDSLTRIVLPQSLETITFQAFDDCPELKEILIKDLASWLNINFGETGTLLTSASGAKLYINGSEISGNISIPNGITAIPAYAFSGQTKITGIVIPDGVTSIGNKAFSGCTGITNISIPNSVTSIGSAAFYNCTALESLTIPSSVSKIETETFCGCSKLKTITIQNGVTEIENEAFRNCTSLESVVLPDSVTNLGFSVFENCSALASISFSTNVITVSNSLLKNCTSLESVIIPDNIKNIEGYAFSGCTALKQVTIANGVTDIGFNAFSGCSSLTYVTLPNSVINLGTYAFQDCKGLLGLTLSTGLTEISNSAFAGCSGLVSLVIPNSITTIESNAFQYCYSIEEVKITDFEAWCNITFRDATSNPLAVSSQATLCVNGTVLQGKVIIPEGITIIPQYTFRNCTEMTEIFLPSSLSHIGHHAFLNCSSVERVNVTNLESWCGISFASDYSNPIYASSNAMLVIAGELPLGYFAIPEGITVIPACSFRNTNITLLSLPSTLSTIGNNAFLNCSSLEQVDIPDLKTWCSIKFGDKSANPLYVSNAKLYFNGKALSGMITVPDGAKTIPYRTFAEHGEITDIILPNSVTTVEDMAFYGCSGLKTIHFGASVSKIGDTLPLFLSFEGCSSLESITVSPNNSRYSAEGNCLLNSSQTIVFGCKTSVIPDSAKKIADYAFFGCTGITEIVIPNNVTTIGEYAFYGCSGIKSLTLGKNVQSFGYSTFFGCTAIEELSVASGNKTFFSSGNCIMISGTNVLVIGCKASVIPNTVTTIAPMAFYGCTQLKSIHIPASVTSIEQLAFVDCTSLASITVAPENKKYYSQNNCVIEKSSLTVVLGCKTSVIPDDAKAIGMYAFYRCAGLESMHIPTKVTQIGSYAFNGCNDLKNLTVASNNSVYYSKNNCIIKKETESLTVGCNTSVIPEGIKAIGVAAFGECNGIESLFLPSSVERIEKDAFYMCSNLYAVNLPHSLQYIGEGAFNGCSNLMLLDIPAKVEYIGAYAFSETAILTAEIPAPTTYVGEYAFAYCENLMEVLIHGSPNILENAFIGCGTNALLNEYYTPSFIFYESPSRINGSTDTIPSNFILFILEDDTVTGEYANEHNYVLYIHGKESCVFDNKRISAAALHTPGSCTQKAEYYLSCACGRIGNGDSFTGDLSHVFTKRVITDEYKVSDANCTGAALYLFSCEYCGEKSSNTFEYGEKLPHSFTAQNTSQEYLRSNASCHQKAEYYYSCETCGQKGTDYFRFGEITDHKYTRMSATDEYLVSPASCSARAVYVYCCATCDKKGEETYEYGVILPHIYTKQVITDEYLYTPADCYHYAQYYYCCETCDLKGDATYVHYAPVPHIFTKQIPAFEYMVSAMTCTEKAVYYYCCELCGQRGTETYEYGNPQHTPDSILYYSSEVHYGKCTVCQEKLDVTEHSYGTDDICTECGYLKGSGVEVTVKVTSFGEESASVFAELIPEGESTPAYSAECTSSADLTFEVVAPGDYILRVSKTKHVTREYKVTVGEKDTVEVLLRLYGDVDNNGKINAADATQIKRYYNNKTSVFSSADSGELEYLLKAADVNGDGTANAADATQIKRYYNNKTSVFTNIP